MHFSDALSIVLSALYAKFIFVLGIALPVTDIVSDLRVHSMQFQ
jgi:hypothetical protein